MILLRTLPEKRSEAGNSNTGGGEKDDAEALREQKLRREEDAGQVEKERSEGEPSTQDSKREERKADPSLCSG
ncbi:MAG: hypothetical protein WCE61_23370 [Candidatus Acidiferrum sp.]